jgi:hypothetical protein
MATTILGGVPLIDMSSIGKVYDNFKAGRKEAARDRTLAELGQGASVSDIARKLFQAGDIEGGLSLAQLGNAQAQQEWNRTYQGGMLDVARKTADRREVPAQVQVLQAAGIDPASPEGRKALFPRTDTPISATDKKAIFEAEDEMPVIQGTLESLKRAKELNEKTFTGYTAGTRGAIATKVPGGSILFDKEAGLATEEWSKIMGPEALQTMANTLKGATTDFELKQFISMLADPSTDPKVRRTVIDRLEKLAQRKMQIQQSRTKELRSGSYFKPEGGPSVAPQGGGGLPRVSSPAEAAKLPKGTRFLDPNGVERVVP